MKLIDVQVLHKTFPKKEKQQHFLPLSTTIGYASGARAISVLNFN